MNKERFLTQHCGGLCITSKSAVGIGLLLMLITLAACASSSEPTATPTTSADKLAEILARGTLIVATDPNYAPQSELKEDVARAANTRCASNQYTANQLEGFDVDVAAEIASRLGVEACFVTPAWTLIVGGSWVDRWDINVGSMTITPERMEVLYFTQPYYTTPAAFFVHEDNTSFAQPSDLSGKRIGVCTGCTYEFFLDGSLNIPGEKIDFVVKDSIIHGYEIDMPAMQDLALGDGVDPRGPAAQAIGRAGFL